MLDERKNCPICSDIKFKTIFSLPYKNISFLKNYYKDKINPYLNELEKYDYVISECLNCSLIFQKHIPNENFSELLYEKIINDEESKIKKLSVSGHLKDFELFKKIIKKENQDISILEFSSGNGDWAYEAKKLNFDITANEYSKIRIETLKKKSLKVCDNINACKDKFDIIYSDQVFEHIPNPAETLKLLMTLLKSHGYIYLKFPSSFMFKNKLKMNYQPQKDCAHPLEHINTFNRKAFSHLIKDMNLEIFYHNRHSAFNYKKYLKLLKDFFYFDQILIKIKSKN